MAEDNVTKGFNIELGLDPKGLKSGVAQIRNTFVGLEKTANDFKKAFELNPTNSNLKEYEQAYTNLINKSKEALESLRKVEEENSKTVTDKGKASTYWQNLQKNIAQATLDIEKANKELTTIGEIKSFQKQIEDISNFNKEIRTTAEETKKAFEIEGSNKNLKAYEDAYVQMLNNARKSLEDLKKLEAENGSAIQSNSAKTQSWALLQQEIKKATEDIKKAEDELKKIEQLNAFKNQVEKAIEFQRESSKVADNLKKINNVNPNAKNLNAYREALTVMLVKSTATLEVLKRLSQQNVNKNTESWKKLQESIEKVTYDIERAKGEIKKIDEAEAIRKEKEEFEKLKEAEEKEAEAKRKAKEEEEAHTRAVEEAEQKMREYESAVSSVVNVLGQLSNRALRRVVRAYRDLISASYEAGASFQQSMSNLEGLFIGISRDDLKLLEDTTRQLGITGRYSANEIADSMEAMALAGYDAQQTAMAIGDALNLATASGEDFGTVSNILVDGLAAFNMSASESQHFADALMKTAVSTNTDVGKLGDAFKYAGAIAGAFGYSVEDVGVALGSMATNGIKGSQAGTTLRTTLIRLGNNTNHAQDKFNALGKSFYDNSGKAMDLMSVLEQLRSGLHDATDEERTAILTSIGGQRAVTGLTAIVKMDEEAWKDLKDAIYDNEGAVEKISKVKLDNLADDVTKLKNNFNEVAIEIYDELEPALRDGAQELTKLLQSDATKKFVKQIGDLTNKLIKFATKGIQFVIEHFDELMAVAKATMIMLAGFSLMRIIDRFKNFAKSLRTAIALFSETGSAVALLQPLLFGLVAGISAITLVTSAMKSKFEEENSVLYDNKKAIDELKESQDELHTSSQDAINDEMSKNEYYKSLLDEAKTLVDENGEVITGYEARANYIKTTLSEAFGIEFDSIQDIISAYDTLIGKLEEVTKTKIAQQLAEEYAGLVESIGDVLNEKLVAENNFETTLITALDNVESVWNDKFSDKLVPIDYETLMLNGYEEAYKYIQENNLGYLLDSSVATAGQNLNDINSVLEDLETNLYNTKEGMRILQEGTVADYEAFLQTTTGYIQTVNDLFNDEDRIKAFEENARLIDFYTGIYTDAMEKGNEEIANYSKAQIDAIKGVNTDIYGAIEDTSQLINSAQYMNTDEPITIEVDTQGVDDATQSVTDLEDVLAEVDEEGLDFDEEIDALDELETEVEETSTALDELFNNVTPTGKGIDSSQVLLQLQDLSGSLESARESLNAVGFTMGEYITEGIKIKLNELLTTIFTDLNTETLPQTLTRFLATMVETLNGLMPTFMEVLNTNVLQPSMLSLMELSGEGLIANQQVLYDAFQTVAEYSLEGAKLTDARWQEVGIFYIQGIINGMNAKKQELFNLANEIANSINEIFSSVWVIGSPSRLSYQYASWYNEGLANGFTDTMGMVVDSAGGVANAVNDAVNNTLSNGALAVNGLNVHTDVTSLFSNALKNVSMVVNNNIDMDGRQVATRVSQIQGMEIKRNGG